MVGQFTIRLATILLTLAVSGLYGQTTEPPPAAGQEPPQGDSQRSEPAPAVSTPIIGRSLDSEAQDIPIEGHVVPLPAIVGGFAPTLAFTPSATASNFLSGGINVGASYDDNALIAPQDTISNWSYSFFPNISIQQTRSRIRWDLNYGAGFTFNQESQNQGSHDLNFSLLYRLSPHVNLIVGDQFTSTSGGFNQLGSNTTPQPGPSGGENSSVVLPLSSQIGNSTSAQLGYQFTASDAVGVSGGYYFTNYSDAPVGTTLYDTRSAQASGFYTHRITERNWAGVSYRLQRLSFTDGSGKTLVHSILFFDTFTLPGRISVSLFAGPEYTDIVSQLVGLSDPTSSQKWSLAAGASLNWTGQRTSYVVDFVRRTNDGGGFQGATQMLSFSGGARHQLTRFWTVSAGGSYGKNDSLTIATGLPSSIKSASIHAGVDRKLGRSVNLQASYFHEFQSGQDLNFPGDTAQRNRVLVSVSYSFSRPLGR